MIKRILPFLNFIGFLIVVGYLLVDHFLITIPDTVGIPMIFVAIVFILIGNIYSRNQRKNKN